MNNFTQTDLNSSTNFFNKLISRTLLVIVLFIGSLSFAQSFRTPTFTGNLTDFNATERFVSVDATVTYAITFDATYMYFGAFRTIGTFNTADNLTLYLDTDPRNTLNSGNGTTAGRNFNNVTPVLPFNADYASVTEQSYTDPLQRFNGSWATAGVTPSTFTSTTCREVRIALSDLGNPASVYATFWMGYAGGIFANAPGTAVTASSTPTITGFFGSFPVYKAGITPVTFRTQDIISANGGGTAISNLSVTANTSANGDYGDVTITGAFAWTLNGNSSFTGALTVGSGSTNASKVDLASFGLYVGGRGVGGTAGVVSLNGSSGTVLQSSGTSTFNFLGAGSINGANTTKLMPSGMTMTLGGAVDFFASGTVPVNFGTGSALQINPNGSVITNAPLYGSGSTLIYNTGGTYGASTEWLPNITTGAGYPGKVTIQNNTAVNFGAATTFRQLSGLLTIGSGSSLTLSSAVGGDLRIAGGLTNNNTGSGVGINTNGRAVQSMGTGTYTKAGTDNLDFLIIGSANTLTLATGTNLNLTNTNASGALQFNAVGTLAMAGTNTVTLAAGTTVAGTTAGSITGSSPSTSILNLAGACTWNSGGVVTSSINVGIQVNAGLTITTAGRLSAGYLQINPGGFIGGTNPVVYPASGTLVYNHSSGTYGVQALEFPAASGPTNLIVNANGASTGISFATNNITARTLAGTLTINHDVDLSGSGPAALTALNVVANATALVKGSGNFTLSAAGSFTTANVGGINGTLTTSGTKTLPASGASFTFNNATASQVTGALLPASVAALTINNPTAATGTTISNNTLTISGTTTLTAGALVLPTGASNLVTFSGAISTPTSGGTITGSTTSNITTNATSPGIAGTGSGIVFTAGGQNLGNWTCTTVFGAATPTGLNSPLTINGTFSFPSASPDLFTTASGSITFVSGSTFTQNGTGGARILGSGTCTVNSGANMIIVSTTGLASSGANGAIQTNTRTFSGGANYTFNNISAVQTIGDALDAAGGTGKTGIITGNLTFNNNVGAGVTLNAGTTITVNSPGAVTLGSATSSGILTAPVNSIINGSGNVTFLGNGATSGSTLVTAHANGVNGTFAGTGTFSLTNGANNNTNFTFNGSVAQTTGSLMPTIVNNLTFSNTFSGALATPSVTLSSSVTVNGSTSATGTSPVGVVSIGAGNSLNINGAITTTANRFIGTATSNLNIGGSGAISAVGLFLSGGGALNNFTMNRTGVTATIGTPLTVSGTYSSTAGVIAMATNTLTLSGPIVFGAATLTATGPFVVNGTGTITGSLLGTATPIAFSGITMNRAGATLPLGMNVTVSNAVGLTLTAGNIALGTFNLTNTNTAGTLGVGSATSMVVATGTGKAYTSFPTGATAARTFPIGDGTNYSPVTLSFSANTVAGTVGAGVTATAHPQYANSGVQTDYLNRYWSFITTGLTTYTYTSTFGYVAGDIVGTETNIKLNRWNGASWVEDATSAAILNTLTSTTGLTDSNGLLNGNDFTGRKEITATSYVWNGSISNDWATAANWTPNGVPAALDNVTINVTGANTNCTVNSGSKTINNFTLNGTGAFAMLSGTSINVNGTVTYGGSATANLDCASTFNYSSTSSQTVAALNYGNLNLTGGVRVLASSGTIGICGAFTTGAGSFTNAGSTIDFNGTGSQTIPAFAYNNLTSSSTGARVLASSGSVAIAGTFVPSTNVYTTTGSTVDFNGTGTQTIPAFPNFNNLTISGARGSSIVTLATGTIGVGATFTASATAVTYSTTGNTFDYISTGSQTITGFNKYNNLSNSGNGARTLANTPNIVVDGVYSPTTNTVTVGTSTIDFSSASSQTIPATFYYNLTNSGNGTRTWASSGIIDINAAFSPTTAVNTITGSTLRYSSTAASTFTMGSFTTNVTNRQYNNLIMVGGASTIWQLGSGFNLGLTGDYSITGSGTFNICPNATANTMNIDGNFTVGTSAGKVNVTSSSGAGTLNVTGNFIQSGTGTITVSGGTGLGIANITGNFAISSGTINGNAATTTSKNAEVYVGGTYSQTGGTINLQNNTSSSGATYGFMQVNGDFTLTSGTFEFATTGVSSLSTNFGELDLKGNFIRNGSSNTLKATGSGYNGSIYFIGTSPQTINVTTTTPTTNFIETIINSASNVTLLSNYKQSAVTVNSGGTLLCGTNLIQDANTACTFTNNGTLGIGSTAGIVSGTTLSGNIQGTGTRTFATTGNYIYNGVAAQVTGSGLPATVNNLTINNSTGVTLSQSVIATNILDFQNGLLNSPTATPITISASGSITNATATKYVNGKLNRLYSAIGSKTFPIGKGGNYRPVTFEYTALTGTSTVSTEQFEAVLTPLPANANTNSTRYWDVSQTGGSAFNYIVTLDPTGDTTTGTVVLFKKESGATTSNAATTPNYTNTTGFTTLTGTNSFALGSDCTQTAVAGANQTICLGSTATLAATAPTYGSGAWTVTGPSTLTSQFSSISSATAVFTPAGGAGVYTLTWTVTNGNCSSNASITITVNPTSVAGNITGAGSVCTGTNSTTLTLNGSTGTIQWQSSSDNSNFSDISGEIGTTYTVTNLATTTYYRAVVTSGICTSATTTSVTVAVNPTSVSGSISGGGVSVCAGTNSTILTLTGNTGTIQWQSSSDNVTFNTISGQTGSTYTATNINATTYYRALVTSGACASATTTSEVITIKINVAITSISASANPICASATATLTANGVVGTNALVTWWTGSGGTGT
ncbi:MAG: hypothetical protein K2P85_00270, partial [Flavobacteriaceae bacterium]|nr:hypothetical protein [Flavobacteriaceae bacterium]